MKFGLDNMRVLCDALAHPERSFRPILIAGTNGKGSVTAMVAAALRAAGHRTARYTSPHLVRLEERFVIDGREIEPGALRDSAARVRAVVAALVSAGTLDGPPTFFECTTAVAFDLFREAGVDLAVLEVGLGGRLDATNVVTPIASAITSIAKDHEAQLGSTLASIAREKAGVMRPGVPVVCGPLPPEARAVVESESARLEAPLVDTVTAVEMIATGDAIASRSTSERRIAPCARCASASLAAINSTTRPWPSRCSTCSTSKGIACRTTPCGAAWRSRDGQAGWNGSGSRTATSCSTRPTIPPGRRRWPRISNAWAGPASRWSSGRWPTRTSTGMLAPLLPLCGRLICVTAPSPRAMPAADLARTARAGAGRGLQIGITPDPADAARRRHDGGAGRGRRIHLSGRPRA
jgi:folylpolyglutamate synthase/dihydropteroate synthase